MKNNVIEFSQYCQPVPFDFEAYNRRAEIRFRNSQLRAWMLQIVDLTVTASIGLCVLFCMYLTLTML